MTQTHSVDVCIAGGGPAGLLLGLLLARQGISTLVLEQHQDFSREYRGEVLMPRFSRLFSQLNLLDYIQQFPHTRITTFELRTGKNQRGHQVPFQQLCPDFPFALWMPQPILLDALYQKAKTMPQFDLWFWASAIELIQEQQKTVGVRVQQQDQIIDVQAKITVGADGRTSRVQRLGNFELELDNYEFDVIWFSLPRPSGVENTVQALFTKTGRYIIAPKYPDLIQCGLLTAPGQFTEFRKHGIESIQNCLKEGPDVFQAFAETLQDFKPFHPLQARIARVKQWAKDGLLLIGDAAHTCSPMGAIGVSIAMETAAVAATVIAQALRQNDVSALALNQVQAIRGAEVSAVQHIQEVLGHTFVKSALPAWMFPLLIRGAIQFNFMQQNMRRLVVGNPIKVDPSLSF